MLKSIDFTKIATWLYKRGTEWSTLRGVVSIGMAVALIINPEGYIATLAAGSGMIGVINTLRDEGKNDKL